MTGTTEIVLNRMEYVLTEDNYDDWYEDFILELQGAGLSEYAEKNIDDIVKEEKEKYTTKDEEGKDILSEEGENKIKKHKMNNFKVLSFLRKSVDAKIKSFIRNKKEEKNSAYLILKVLKDKYHEEEINEVPKLFRRLENMKAESDKETLKYIEEFLDITQKLKKLNNELSNREKMNYLFNGLPEKQLNFLEIKYSISNDVDKILEDMKKQIRNRRTFIPEKNMDKKEEISHITKEKIKNNNKNKHSNFENYDEDDTCERYRNERRNNRKKRCYLCDSEEHLVYHCPFNLKNPHNSIKHIAEQFRKLNISVENINNIELCYDSDSDSNIVEIKEISLIEPENETEENNIEEINLCEINTTSNNNYNNQHLEFETVNDTTKINYVTKYYDNSSENGKFENNNTLNKTENTNIFQEENNINYDLNNYFVNNTYDNYEYKNNNYKDLILNSDIFNSEEKYSTELLLDKINKINCKLNELIESLNIINKKNDSIHRIIKNNLPCENQECMEIIKQYNNILNNNDFVNYNCESNVNDIRNILRNSSNYICDINEKMCNYDNKPPDNLKSNSEISIKDTNMENKSNIGYDSSGNRINEKVNNNILGENVEKKYENNEKNIFSEKKFFNNKNLSKIDQKSRINTNMQNLKFNSNVRKNLEFESDSLAVKNLSCTTTNT